MATKGKVEEFDVCDIKESGSAIVHGVVTEFHSCPDIIKYCSCIQVKE